MNFLAENKRALETLTAWTRSERFPHAVLIEGQQGSGRKTFATYLAQGMLCDRENKPCGVCNHCQKIAKKIHPDVIIAQGKGGARSFHIDTIREIRREAFIRPNEGKRKVFVLLEASEMTIQAQNALLTILEEPPKNVHFVLICENRQQMLSTIQSRSMIITMEIPDVDTSARVLAEKIHGKSEEEYHRAALQASGNIGKAMALLEDEEAEKRYQLANKLWQALLEGKELEALSLMEDCERDKPLFLERLSILRSFAVNQAIKKQHSHRISALQLTQIVDIIDEITIACEGNVNMLLLTTLLCSKIRAVLTVQ